MATVPFDGDGDTTADIDPGDRVEKNGKGNLTAWLTGGISIVKDGPGNIYLKGLNDYSVVTIDPMNGDGSILFHPGDVRPPKVRNHNGKGTVQGN